MAVTGAVQTTEKQAARSSAGAPPALAPAAEEVGAGTGMPRYLKGGAGSGSGKAGKPGADDAAPVDVDLQQIGNSYDRVPESVTAWLAGRKGKPGRVNAHFGGLTATRPILLRQTRGSKQAPPAVELAQPAALPLNHQLFAGLEENDPLRPHLYLTADPKARSDVAGHVGLGPKVAQAAALAGQLQRHAELIGLRGLAVTKAPKLTNELKDGHLQLGLDNLEVRLGKILSGTITVLASENGVTKFEGSATAAVRGLGEGHVTLTRSEQGVVTGKGDATVQLSKNVTGSVNLAWDGESVSGSGKVTYKGEKLSGQLDLQVMDEAQANQLAKEKQPPPPVAAPAAALSAQPGASAPAAKRRGPPSYTVFGAGSLTFAFNEWLSGAAQVILDPQGEVTVIGEITPQKELRLFPRDRPQQDYTKPIFSLEARAGYGIPVVGEIGIFGKVSLDAFASLGPAMLYNIAVKGEYSTDPKKKNDFRIQATLSVSAAAGLRLRAEAGAVLEILDHDLKAGVGVNGVAGVRGYVKVEPVIGYREAAAEGEDKKGQFFISGDMEIAAQPFLGLSGDLFVEIDAPWWSPLDDDRWTWELGSKTWPIGGTVGLGATVDYVFGSGELPSIEFKPVESFSVDSFLTGLFDDEAKASGAGAAEKAGQWKEKNTPEAAPPTGGTAGNVAPTSAPTTAQSAAKPSARAAQPAGPKQVTKPAQPNTRTAEGKTVQEYQEEARQKGGKPAGKQPAPDTAKPEPAAKAPDRQEHDVRLQEGLAALDAVTQRYAQTGATREEAENGVKAVRRKFKVFKSIEVVDGGDAWDYAYVASQGRGKLARKAAGGAQPAAPGGGAKRPAWISPQATQQQVNRIQALYAHAPTAEEARFRNLFRIGNQAQIEAELRRLERQLELQADIQEQQAIATSGQRVLGETGAKEISKLPGKAPVESGAKGTAGEATHALEVVPQVPRRLKKLYSAAEISKERAALLQGHITLREFVEELPTEGAAQVFFPASAGSGRYIDHVYFDQNTKDVVFRESKTYTVFSLDPKGLVQLQKDLSFLGRFTGLRIEWRISGQVEQDTLTILDQVQANNGGLFRYLLD